MASTSLPAIPYAVWEPTKTTLHLYAQIVGKIRLRYVPHRNHWWNVTLIPTARGFSTLRMREGETLFDIEFDFVAHEVLVRSNRSPDHVAIPLHDGLSVAAFYRALLDALRAFGIEPELLPKPYGIPIATPFPEDEEHRSYDRDAVRRWFEVTVWTAGVFEEFASRFTGKQSPAHLFWHSFDLAMARFSGRRAGERNGGIVEAEAYSHEVISFGFWAGDANTPAPTYYTYTAPEPSTLTQHSLANGAAWQPAGAGHLGTLPYDAVRTASDPRAALLAFLESGYRAGAVSAGWDADAFATAYHGADMRA